MDDHYIYIFVRTDFTLAEQFLNGIHAMERLATLRRYSDSGIPNAVLIGLPSEKSLKRAVRYMSECQLPCLAWSDPDKGLDILALAVGPISPQQKPLLKKYVLYSPGAPKGACLLTEDGGAKAAVAQLTEHQPFRLGVDGSIPSCGSNSQNGDDFLKAMEAQGMKLI